MRDDVPQLLEHLKRLQLPTTWATVSGMLEPNKNQPQVDHLPTDYQQQIRHFLNHSERQTHDGTDLIELVHAMGKDLCEIASHSATHIYADHASTTKQAYLADIAQSVDVLQKELSIEIDSLVFPRDQSQHRAEIATSLQQLNMRLSPNVDKIRRPGAIERAIVGMYQFLADVPQSDTRDTGQGATYQLGSMYFNATGGRYKRVKTRLLKTKIKRLLSSLADENNPQQTYHIWLHPFNLSESMTNKTLFFDFLESLAQLRDKDLIEVMSMSQIGRAYRKAS